MRRLPPGPRRAQGGVRHWARIKRELLRYLKEDTGRFLTTMFDYYGLPSDWPGWKQARHKTQISAKAKEIEQAIHADVCNELGKSFDGAKFLPHIQMHEFEALLFSNTEIFVGAVPSTSADLQSRLDEILAEYKEPEGIDDGPETAPSKRILALVPSYQKPIHGIIAAQRIGLTAMRERCPHFAQWCESLERLG